MGARITSNPMVQLGTFSKEWAILLPGMASPFSRPAGYSEESVEKQEMPPMLF